MTEHEPVDTSLPWARKRTEPWTQVDAERAAYERAVREQMTKPGNGKVHPGSITTPDYEPNRAMVPKGGANDIIRKMGKKQPGYNDVEVRWTDRVVVYSVITALVLIVAVVVFTAHRLG